MSKETKTLLVDPNSKFSYKTIQKAINDASPFSTIKIVSGYYQGFVVNKPLTIEALSINENVIILADAKDTITVDYKGEGKTLLRYLKVGNTASDSKIVLSNLKKMFITTHQDSKDFNPYVNYARFYNSKLQSNSILRIVSGEAVAEKCLFSFKLLTKSFENQTIGIILEEKTKASLFNCEVIGNEFHFSQGILVHRANLILDSCIITKHLDSGVCLYLD